jgi:OmpA-OmpF porin, OOP family
MKYLTPFILSFFGLLISLTTASGHDSNVKLHGKVYDFESHQPILADVQVVIFYNSDFVKDDSCKTVSGEFTATLNKLGWYLISLTANGYLEVTDTLWILSATRQQIEREYFLSSLENQIEIASTGDNTFQDNWKRKARPENISSWKEARPDSTLCIYFPFGKCSLPEAAMAELSNVADYLKDHPTVFLEVYGHSDVRGPEDYNLMLSQWRADVVSKYLLEHGVEGSKLLARGLGASRPITLNQTREGQAKNRRVELVLINSASDIVAVDRTNP